MDWNFKKLALFALGFIVVLGTIAGSAMSRTAQPGGQQASKSEQRLGSLLFSDTNLSSPAGQACVSCHDPRFGFAEPDSTLPVSEGVVAGRFGTRNAPSVGYAAFSPMFHFDAQTNMYIGGQFWDGRAPDLTSQAAGPFQNPVEMNNTKAGVVEAVRNSRYAGLFRDVYGADSLDNVDTAFNDITQAIASFEGTKKVNRFSSKYDEYLMGKAVLTPQEQNGLALFNDPAKGKCSLCHTSTAMGDTPAVFTSHAYDNLGIPKNPEIENLIGSPVPQDLGLGGYLASQGDASAQLQDGKFKMPTLRNVAKSGPYSHNGYFKSLKEMVHFYNTRDVLPTCEPGDPGEKVTCWPVPEVAENVNTFVGNLGLTPQEEDDIVSFLGTLTDGNDD